MFILLCVYFAVSFFAVAGHAGEADQKSQPAVKATEKAPKDTSLYLYYQQHLKPYFANSSVKPSDNKYKEPEQKAAPQPVTPTGSLVLSRSKTDDASPDKSKEASEATSYVTLNRIDSVGLEAMNKSFPKEFRKEYIAELALGIKLSPMVDLTFGKVQKFERSESTPWESRDDGWRLRLKKDF